MDKLSVKQLKVLAKDRGLPKYYKLRKAELIEAHAPPKPAPLNNTNIPDEPIPEINIPILKPFKPIFNYIAPSAKHLTSKVYVSVNKKIKEFSDWIISYVPESIQKTVNKRVESLKEQVNQIFKKPKKLDQFTPKEHETALAGYLKTYRIDGQTGYGPKTFTANIKPKVVDLINKQKKPLKVKLILTCKFIK